MAAGTLVSRVLGLVRLGLLTACVGAPLVGSAFQVANTLPSYAFALLAGGVLNAVLLPQIVKVATRPDEGRGFVDRLLTAALIAVLGLTVMITVLARSLVELTTGFGPQVADLATFFALICLPQCAGYGVYAILSQVLNARGQFAAVMWAPVLANVVQIGGMLIFLQRYVFAPEIASWSAGMVWLLAGSMTAGIWAQAAVLIIPLVRGGFRWRPRFDLRGHGLWAASAIVGWTFAALVLAQLGGLFTQWVLTRVEQRHAELAVGTVYLFQIAFVIFMLPHSLITTSVLTALFPRMAVAARDHDDAAQRGLVRTALTVPALALVPIGAAAAVLAGPVVAVVQPGLSTAQVAVTAQMLRMLVLGLVPFGITVLQQRFAFAYGQGRRNLWLQGVLTGFAVLAGALALVLPPAWAGVLVTTGLAIGEWVTATVFVWLAQRQLGGLGMCGVITLYLRLAAAAAVAAMITVVVHRVVALPLTGYPAALVELALGSLVFLAGYAGLARALRLVEYRALVDRLRG